MQEPYREDPWRTKLILGKSRDDWYQQCPLLPSLVGTTEVLWLNPHLTTSRTALSGVALTSADVDDAADRLLRFAPFLAEIFPDTRSSRGIIESRIVAIPAMQQALTNSYGQSIDSLWLKLDSELPISGSIKARGGIYEVLAHAEAIALDAGVLKLDDDYRVLSGSSAKQLFAKHTIAVGSTGNLGLSIGVMSAALGFHVTVHMSSDARQWKKDKLRDHGVTVVEHEADYSVAVAAGRSEAEGDSFTYFIDDENSETLFLGYAVAARRLAGQLQALDIRVDDAHPLVVYLPCGVGGGPGGVAFGLKTIFGDNVHCIFAEPTHSPAMLLGMYTGMHEMVSVQDFGIDNLTAADGLAVGRPSGLVGRRMEHLLTGVYTVDDNELFRMVSMLHDTEQLKIEPSAAASLPGAFRLARDLRQGVSCQLLSPERFRNATHIAWATGGGMVPDIEMETYISRGRALSD
ncbi:D-serine ammonia-lyase [Rhodococcus erythropolis]|uniref:D-serine ammonia-lyase n=1 Tax=Rhodococcus erythropolis TaxID=1833 RepID=UPI003D0A8619